MFNIIILDIPPHLLMEWKILNITLKVPENACFISPNRYLAKANINNKVIIGKYNDNSFFYGVSFDHNHVIKRDGYVDVLIIPESELYIQKWHPVTVNSTSASSLHIPG